ncbi:MAG: 16S rRNA (cytosine(1402)-N(4))-methyltransferase RsmH [Patescibacteria group bacterium]|nr:16S rRNA (cytosine(1402)-N(4))-methyltransferase RsmH [Patescibacteria group bacterium]
MTSVRAQGRSRREESGRAHEQESVHVPVMVHEVIDALALQKGQLVLDATYGQGGHSVALKKAARIKLIGLDADPAMVGRAKSGVVNANFADLAHVAGDLGITRFDRALFDLGWNRGQLSGGRGFSFMRDEPLLMSYGAQPRSGFFARDILNNWSEKAIADALYGYGEERYARPIARAVVERRALAPIHTTFELVEIIRDAVPRRYLHGKVHFATRTFQALRIATNDELRALHDGLSSAWKLLGCGGRLVVITFHSIEDRVVKQLLKTFAAHNGKLLYKKPLVPTRAEIIRNPASRSAKLRAIEKVCR